MLFINNKQDVTYRKYRFYARLGICAMLVYRLTSVDVIEGIAMMKNLPIGVQSFEDIIKSNCVYIDKTKEIYNLVKTGKVYFLSRPRRFGKSTLCSTLEAIFLGKKELFKGLWIETSDYDWKKYPVIHISWGTIYNKNAEAFERSIHLELNRIARKYAIKVSLSENNIQDHLKDLIIALYQRGPVVIIIDEYDKPILDNIVEIEKAQEIRNVLKDFYSIIKELSNFTRFIFVTGVTKFSKVSIFSGFNNLQDISMSEKAATIAGYTKKDLETYLEDRITFIAKKLKKSVDDIMDELTRYYDGYFFELHGKPVYNPFSILNCLDEGKFHSYWFASGTPTFLLDLIKKNDYDVIQTDSVNIAATDFDVCDVDRLKLSVLLFQSGYLTLKSFDSESDNYELVCPNYEVRSALTGHIFELMTTLDKSNVGDFIKEFKRAIAADDIELFCAHFKELLETIPYTVKIKSEKYYQSVLFLIMRLVGLEALAEVPTDFGRIDLTFQTKKHIYLIECKHRGTPDSAIKQMIKNEYAVPYKKSKKKIVYVGISFGLPKVMAKSKKRKVEARWKIQ